MSENQAQEVNPDIIKAFDMMWYYFPVKLISYSVIAC